MKQAKKRTGALVPERGRPTKHNPAAQIAAMRRTNNLRRVRKLQGRDKLIGELVITRTWIDAGLLDVEPELESMAWVENRCLTPLERTELFAHDYAAKYRSVRTKAGKPIGKPIEPEFAANSPAEMNALWRARAEADCLGMPYDLYLDVIIDGHLDRDMWKRPPRPNQLYGKLAEPRLRGRPTVAEASNRIRANPAFSADTYSGSPVQEAGLAVLRADVEGAENPTLRLALYLIGLRMITRDRAESMFGTAMVEAAVALRGEPAASSAVPSSRHVPTCFGHYSSRERAPCRSCPVASDCQGLGAEVSAELIQATGSDNPRLAHKRRVDRERQRRHRQKKKGKA